MINVELSGDAVVVNMNGTAYHLPNATDCRAFRAALSVATSIDTLVLSFLDRLQRVAKLMVYRVATAVLDAYHYVRGMSAPTHAQIQAFRFAV
jgi:hypothetical protein